jgi:hypothetical protein
LRLSRRAGGDHAERGDVRAALHVGLAHPGLDELIEQERPEHVLGQGGQEGGGTPQAADPDGHVEGRAAGDGLGREARRGGLANEQVDQGFAGNQDHRASPEGGMGILVTASGLTPERALPYRAARDRWQEPQSS